MVDPIAFRLLSGNFGHVEDGDVVTVGNQVEDVEVKEVGVQLEVFAELAVGNGPPFLLRHHLSVVILDPTAPVVRHLTDDVLVLHLLGSKASFSHVLQVEVVIVIININADKTFWHNIEGVDVLKVVVDLNSAVLPQDHSHMVEIAH